MSDRNLLVRMIVVICWEQALVLQAEMLQNYHDNMRNLETKQLLAREIRMVRRDRRSARLLIRDFRRSLAERLPLNDLE